MSSKFDNDEITINIRELLFALWSKIYIIIAVILTIWLVFRMIIDRIHKGL